ncbi:hypothetical protein K439DRAFT_177821 [Ramaria rubella]|nr:hypothetical protein K439DRAFT_177821 [Ramaria rubella]
MPHPFQYSRRPLSPPVSLSAPSGPPPPPQNTIDDWRRNIGIPDAYQGRHPRPRGRYNPADYSGDELGIFTMSGVSNRPSGSDRVIPPAALTFDPLTLPVCDLGYVCELDHCGKFVLNVNSAHHINKYHPRYQVEDLNTQGREGDNKKTWAYAGEETRFQSERPNDNDNLGEGPSNWAGQYIR